MSFSPIVPMGGFAGWRFLERTLDRQEASHAANPAYQREEAYFRARIGEIDSAAALVEDRRLLRTALTAFGLSADLPNRAFIRKVLESDPNDRRSFVNRLADKRYLELTRAFGLAAGGPPLTRDPGQVELLLQRARETRFEEALGQRDDRMRQALALTRDLKRVAAEAGSDQAGWYTVLGTPSLRTVFETAFGLPREFGALDLDRQVGILKQRTERLTGDPGIAQFTGQGPMDTLIRRFFVGAQLAEIRQGGAASAALSLLQAIPPIQAPEPRRR